MMMPHSQANTIQAPIFGLNATIRPAMISIAANHEHKIVTANG